MSKSLDKKPRDKRAEAATKRRKSKFANSRTALERTGDLAFLAKWRLAGLPIDALHAKLNASLEGTRSVSRAQVGFDLKQIDNAWRAERAHAIAHLRDRELAKLDVREMELMEAWEKSKRDAERLTKQVTEEGTVDKDGKFIGDRKTLQSITKHAQYGDINIMNGLLQIQRIRARICGFEAPQKVEHSNPDGTPLAAGPVTPVIQVTIAPPPAH